MPRHPQQKRKNEENEDGQQQEETSCKRPRCAPAPAPPATTTAVVPALCLAFGFGVLDFMDTDSLLETGLVCTGFAARLADLGQYATERAEKTGRQVVPAHQSRPAWIPVERFYRIQLLGSLGMLRPRIGRSVLPTLPPCFGPFARLAPWPVALPAHCPWDDVIAELDRVRPTEQGILRVGDQGLELSVEPDPNAMDCMLARLAARARTTVKAVGAAAVRTICERWGLDANWNVRHDLVARVGPWVVLLPGMSSFGSYGDMLAVHAGRLEPCRGPQWTDDGVSRVVRAVPGGPARWLVSVSPSCAVLYEFELHAPQRESVWVPRFTLWCSPSGTLDVCAVPACLAKDREAGGPWEIAPFDFDTKGALAVIDY